ncbi:MAG: hypothetical protein GX638_07620 [Crenarchaeota archaeon]|nr:hypothetical protein [Thermoproteota archaeon]
MDVSNYVDNNYQKWRNFIFSGRLLGFIVVVLMISTCEGPVGPQGKTGPRGEPAYTVHKVGLFTFDVNNWATRYDTTAGYWTVCAYSFNIGRVNVDSCIVQLFIRKGELYPWFEPDWGVYSELGAPYLRIIDHNIECNGYDGKIVVIGQ